MSFRERACWFRSSLTQISWFVPAVQVGLDIAMLTA